MILKIKLKREDNFDKEIQHVFKCGMDNSPQASQRVSFLAFSSNPSNRWRP